MTLTHIALPFSGAYTALMHTVARDLVHDEHTTMASGILNLFIGCAMLTGNALQGIPCICLAFHNVWVIKKRPLIKVDLPIMYVDSLQGIMHHAFIELSTRSGQYTTIYKRRPI